MTRDRGSSRRVCGRLARGEQALRCAEDLLHHGQLLVAKHDFERREVSVGAQHEDAIEPGVLEGGENRGAVGGVFLGLIVIAADDVAPPGERHRLRLVIDALSTPGDGEG